ncbi:MAG: 4Fe-4S dicluster domain-containing protein [Spirochaetaceae bacterium]|nr:MAG: 4Fe-4S dicluster domain-containing protein [Spirochaetaceae bacterium]
MVKASPQQKVKTTIPQTVADRQNADALNKTIAALQKVIADLLAKKAVDLAIGYGRASGGDIVPLFVRRPEEAPQIVWTQRCTYNLVRYLTDPEVVGKSSVRSREDGRGSGTGKPAAVAVVVKGCDLKSLVVLQSEKQVQREKLTVIALPCQGVTDEAGRLLAKCEICPPDVYNPSRELCDVVIGEPVQRPGGGTLSGPENQSPEYSDVDKLDALSLGERRALWDRYFARCLRCYACRNICPLCYCKECVFDQHDPRWVSPAAAVASNRSFHLIRAYHLAGRCVDCGECERACPVGIPLRQINRKIIKVVEESFHFRAGLDPQAKSPLVAYANKDPQEFIE